MRALLVALTLLLTASRAEAKVITVTTADDYKKIEAARAGDVVEIAPGTYQFRVMLLGKGTAASPITIRAKDPANRPVWDLKGKKVSDWPGSYTAGDRGRGCWQVKGDHYVISGIIFRNCQDSSSAGVRTINSGPVTLRDCLFENNTNGITGSARSYVVEFCEFAKNGKLSSSGSPSHNIYIYGGTFTLRYSYLHDPLEGQNFHVRARDSVIEYNWISRPASYPGDLMSCDTLCGGSGANPITQKMLLRGNIIVQGSPSNRSQIVALYDDSSSGSRDSSGKVSRMELTMIGNTVIGTKVSVGKTHVLVNMRNDGVDTAVTLHNNIFYQLGSLAEPRTLSKSNWSIAGKNNWVSAGTKITGNLSGTIQGTSPDFVSAGASDYHLTGTSACRGKAASLSGSPDREYYLDEVTKLQYRPRVTAKDVGAFEFGNKAAPVGPYGKPPPGDAGPPIKDASHPGLDSNDGSGGSPGPGNNGEGGCSCRAGARENPASPALLLILVVGLLSLRRRLRRAH